MLKVHTVVVTAFSQNARILECTETKEAVVLDPGGEAEKILRLLRDQDLKLAQIWLTHSHLDHCGGVQGILDEVKVLLVGHADEKVMRENVPSIAAMYGMPREDWCACPEPDIFIRGGEVLKLGNQTAQVLFTPGHSPGHVSFFFKEANCLASGDVLFSGSIGRTDLPGGNHATLISSIKRELFALPDEVKVLCGHGEDTSIGDERRNNPYLQGR